MRPNHASPRALPVLYNCSFLFWGRVTLVHACTCILNDPVIQRWSYKFLHIQVSPVLVMSWSVVIVLIWTDAVFPAAKKSFCIYQSTTWLGKILVVLWTIIFLSKVKLCKSCLKTCNWFVVWLRMTSEFFPPTKPPSKTWKRLFQISFFPFNPLLPKSDQHQISPCNSDAL